MVVRWQNQIPEGTNMTQTAQGAPKSIKNPPTEVHTTNREPCPKLAASTHPPKRILFLPTRQDLLITVAVPRLWHRWPSIHAQIAINTKVSILPAHHFNIYWLHVQTPTCVLPSFSIHNPHHGNVYFTHRWPAGQILLPKIISFVGLHQDSFTGCKQGPP